MQAISFTQRLPSIAYLKIGALKLSKNSILMENVATICEKCAVRLCVTHTNTQ